MTMMWNHQQLIRMSESSNVIDEGCGPAVLCLHGFPQNATAFEPLAALLIGRGYRVIRYDQRGYCDTELGARRDYTVTRLAEDAARILDSLDVAKCTVVGHDLGGLVAWEFARRFPERVQTLTIVGMPHPGAFILSLAGLRQLLRSWYFLLAQSTWITAALFSPLVDQSRSRLTRQLKRTGLPPEKSEPYLRYLAKGHRFIGAIRWYQAMPFAPPATTFNRCRSVVLLIWGSEDALTTALAIKLSRLFTVKGRYRVERVAGGGHWLLGSHASLIAESFREGGGRTVNGGDAPAS